MSEDSFLTFDLIRQSDDLVYEFDRRETGNGQIAYLRRDQDLWITYQGAELGWVAFDEERGVTGRPWNILPAHQNADHPPEDIWVSRKDHKSYVYLLKYRQSK